MSDRLEPPPPPPAGISDEDDARERELLDEATRWKINIERRLQRLEVQVESLLIRRINGTSH